MAETLLPLRKYRKLFITGFVVSIGLLFIWFAYSLLFVRLMPNDPERDTGQIERLFPIIEKYQVQQLNNENDCKKVIYNRGKFVSTRDTNRSGRTCGWYLQSAELFDEQAARDFQTIADAIASSGAPLDWLDEVQFDSSSSIVYGHFYIDCFWCNKRYVYSRNYVSLPEDVPNNMWHRAINKDWYIVDESWN